MYKPTWPFGMPQAMHLESAPVLINLVMVAHVSTACQCTGIS
jgi:hypothetical protein